MRHTGIGAYRGHRPLSHVVEWLALGCDAAHLVHDGAGDVTSALHRRRRQHRQLALIADFWRADVADGEGSWRIRNPKPAVDLDPGVSKSENGRRLGRIVRSHAGRPDDGEAGNRGLV